MFYLVQDLVQGGDIFLKYIRYGIHIGHADLFPHLRGGGSNPCYVLKTAGSHLLHNTIGGIVILYQIDQAGGNEMGEMADGSHHLVVFPVIQHQRYGSDGVGNGDDPPVIFTEGGAA